jgi:hypothetical protein
MRNWGGMYPSDVNFCSESDHLKWVSCKYMDSFQLILPHIYIYIVLI